METFGDPNADANAREFLTALQRYIVDGHPVSPDSSPEPDTPPSLSMRVDRAILELYLREQHLLALGDE